VSAESGGQPGRRWDVVTVVVGAYVTGLTGAMAAVIGPLALLFGLVGLGILGALVLVLTRGWGRHPLGLLGVAAGLLSIGVVIVAVGSLVTGFPMGAVVEMGGFLAVGWFVVGIATQRRFAFVAAAACLAAVAVLIPTTVNNGAVDSALVLVAYPGMALGCLGFAWYSGTPSAGRWLGFAVRVGQIALIADALDCLLTVSGRIHAPGGVGIWLAAVVPGDLLLAASLPKIAGHFGPPPAEQGPACPVQPNPPRPKGLAPEPIRWRPLAARLAVTGPILAISSALADARQRASPFASGAQHDVDFGIGTNHSCCGFVSIPRFRLARR